MKYRAIKVGDQIEVSHRGETRKAEVIRVGPVQGQGWAMLKIDIKINDDGGEIGFIAVREAELANPVPAGQSNYATFAEAAQ
jgi:hypothetical protein